MSGKWLDGTLPTVTKPLTNHLRARSAGRSAAKSAATRHVRDLLRVAVLSGRFDRPGGAIPSEAELMLEFSATRNVVREALALLRDEGLVERLQGAGTFVVSEKLLHGFDILHGAGDGYPNRRHRLRGDLHDISVVSAPPLVAAKLELAPNAPCVRADVWVGFDDQPFSLATSYLPARLEPQLRHSAAQGAFSGDFYELLESMGLRLESSSMQLESIVADEHVAPWLGVEPGAPLVLFTRLIRTDTGEPAEYGFIRVRADRLLLDVRLPRGRSGEDDPR